MVDTVNSLVLVNQPPYYTIRLTNVSDGTGESAVVKVDKSGLVDIDGLEPLALDLIGVEWDVGGMNVTILWDHTTPDRAIVLTGQGEWDQSRDGAIRDPRTAGGTGDILLTTGAHTSGDAYMILLRLKMRK